jgi:hypothetical protein
MAVLVSPQANSNPKDTKTIGNRLTANCYQLIAAPSPPFEFI